MAITVPLPHAIRGLGSVLPHASRDSAHPLLAGVRVTRAHFDATDRFTVARYRHTDDADDTGQVVLLPRSAAEWAARITPAGLGCDKEELQSMTADFAPEEITVRFGWGEVAAQHAFPPVELHYPPVENLAARLREARDAYPVWLDGDRLAHFSASAKRLRRGKDVPAVKMALSEAAADRRTPPAVRIWIGDRFEGLLQPARDPR